MAACSVGRGRALEGYEVSGLVRCKSTLPRPNTSCSIPHPQCLHEFLIAHQHSLPNSQASLPSATEQAPSRNHAR
jgi:hypothetical protein